MARNLRDKVTLSGMAVLIIGVALLIFTFISSYWFLTQSISIKASEELVETFGEALAPLIATCIRIMYLGVMGWIGSLLTMRGITLIKTEAATPQKPIVAQQKPTPQKSQPQQITEKQKETAPRGEASQPQTEPKEPQKNNAPPQSPNQ